MTVSCPTCEKAVILKPTSQPSSVDSIEVLAAPLPAQISGGELPKAKKTAGSKFTRLTEQTIREKTSAGNTPLHLAAKNGHIDKIPSHLLSDELFIEKNRDGDTPLHIAARNGTLKSGSATILN